MEEEKKYLDYEGLRTYHTNLCNIIEDNEQVTAAALDDLDDRLKDIETENPYSKLEIDDLLEPITDKLEGIEEFAEVNVLSDWNQTDSNADDYIKNKPTSMPASDVSAWAKASSKPSYTKDEIGLSNVTNDALVKRSEMGAASGVATLDSAGKVPSSQLPSNTGTVTSVAVKMNGSVKGTITTSGTIDLGPVITSYGDMFYGQCSTDATTQAKVATISDFLLVANGNVAIHFTKAISVDGATLNINSTGAKPIYYHGAALTRNVVKADNVVTLQYDGTRYNIVGIEGLQQSQAPDSLVVDMGLPSGVLWAKADIDLTQANKFAASPFQYEKTFFSWGNTDGFNPISNSAFDHNWGGVNAQEPWYDDQPYGETPGAKLTANMAPSQDAARANLGAPWRMPTTEEFAELFANIDYVQADGTTVIDAGTTDKRVTVNSIVGLYLKSKINGNLLFFACSGGGYGTTWGDRGSGGYYWSASFRSARYARHLSFYSGGVYPRFSGLRCHGLAVRPVQ